jgi:peptide chain release factor
VQTSSTAVRVVHRPTGLSVRAEDERSQLANRKAALRRLEQVLHQRHEAEAADGRREAWRAHQGVVRGAAVLVWRTLAAGGLTTPDPTGIPPRDAAAVRRG